MAGLGFERNARYVLAYLYHYSFRPFPERLVGRGPLGGRPMVIYMQGAWASDRCFVYTTLISG